MTPTLLGKGHCTPTKFGLMKSKGSGARRKGKIIIRPNSRNCFKMKRTIETMLSTAENIANYAFADKVDKNGNPYIDHLYNVAFSFSGHLRIIAILHDLVEDCEGWTIERLRTMFDERVCSAVDALTKRDGETYKDYLLRVSENKDAVMVKIEDLKDNMRLGRLTRPLTDKDIERVKKYHNAYVQLLSLANG